MSEQMMMMMMLGLTQICNCNLLNGKKVKSIRFFVCVFGKCFKQKKKMAQNSCLNRFECDFTCHYCLFTSDKENESVEKNRFIKQSSNYVKLVSIISGGLVKMRFVHFIHIAQNTMHLNRTK